MKANTPDFIDLYAGLFDWLTLTSYEPLFYRHWLPYLMQQDDRPEESKVMQYQGHVHSIPGGTAFLGAAIQKGADHYMLRLSGHAAELNKDWALSQHRQGYIRCTRCDLQITVPMPSDWSQWALLTRLKEKGRTTGWIESSVRGRGSQTVYVGSRTSDRFIRVYVKPAGKSDLLRLEVEYKGDRSNTVIREIARGKGTVTQFLLHELQTTLRDDALSLLYEPSLSGAKPLNVRLKVATSLEKQERWLLSQVLPAFTRHVNDHSSNGRVLAAFYAACKDAIETY